jgi:uncharacterized membrane protein
MEQEKSEHSLTDIINYFKQFALYLKNKWLWLILVGLLSAAIGLGIYYLQKPKYEAVCTFILEEKNVSGGLAGLASQFGFDMSSMSGGSLFAGDNILEIITSRNIVNKVLLSRKESNNPETFADLYLEFSELKKGYAKKTYLAGVNFNNVNKKNLSLLQDSILFVIYKRIVKNNLFVERTNKKGSIIKVTVKSPNEYFSKYMSDRVVLEAANLYINIKTNTSQTNIANLQKRADSLLYLLNAKTYSAASFQIINANPALRTAMVPIEIQARDKTIAGTVYAEVVKNLETAKMMLAQQTPIIQILDTATLPLEDNKLRKLIFIVIGGIIGGALSIGYFLLKYLQQNASKQIVED